MRGFVSPNIGRSNLQLPQMKSAIIEFLNQIIPLLSLRKNTDACLKVGTAPKGAKKKVVRCYVHKRERERGSLNEIS